jgi:hypothetical protein
MHTLGVFHQNILSLDNGIYHYLLGAIEIYLITIVQEIEMAQKILFYLL